MPGLFLVGRDANWSNIYPVESTLTIFETITFPKQSIRTRVLRNKSAVN
jgi:hypothetical protein